MGSQISPRPPPSLCKSICHLQRRVAWCHFRPFGLLKVVFSPSFNRVCRVIGPWVPGLPSRQLGSTRPDSTGLALNVDGWRRIRWPSLPVRRVPLGRLWWDGLGSMVMYKLGILDGKCLISGQARSEEPFPVKCESSSPNTPLRHLIGPLSLSL